MKKIVGMTLALISSGSAYARQEVTVVEAKSLSDDRQVTLMGTISGRANDDHYLISRKARVSGKVDRDDGYSEINVDRVYIVK
ncbi:hypothetical protein [Pantoea sp.]|uniref:hypothetical protein n=1 Tax=Pantoea sp. TaxID=69393 RepID=UPI0028B0C225|nr:hypothetical protein [Pantoea sp.]